MKRLVLFDIDGTLLLCGRAPRKAITQAMIKIFGTAGAVDQFSFSGKTDPQIIFELMQSAHIANEIIQAGIPKAIDDYLVALEATLLSGDIKILKGVENLLERVAGHEDIVLGLLTGNVLRGAHLKLSRAGLGHYFFNGMPPLGAFGSDSIHRHDLPAIAVERANVIKHRQFSGKEIVIIGDSPSDVLCGKSLNVKSIAVATGWHKTDELKSYEPDFVFEDLSATDAVTEAILR
ncbi:HAD hydrolase-like protein [bacterium]|nr:HAD hydrolase-like protein [bacterium]